MGRNWAIQFDAHSGIKCYAIVSGKAWFAVDGDDEPLRLEAGECVLLPSRRKFVIASDLGLAPTPFSDIPRSEWLNGVAVINGGGDAMILAGHFAFSGEHVDLLLGAMPSIIPLRDDNDKQGLRWGLERLRLELMDRQPGGILVARNLAHLMLVQALRIYLRHRGGQTVGWLFALGHPQLAASVTAIHRCPEKRWSLAALAETAHMSRSKFCYQFKIVTGSSPIEYLTRWRMLLACDRLLKGNQSISAIASSLGYESESAFSTAFKRMVGCSPRGYSARQEAEHW